MHLRKSTKLFLLISLIIALTNGSFVFINNSLLSSDFAAGLRREGQNLRSSFKTAMGQALTSMRLIASFVGNDPEVQELFLRGKQAVAREGGNSGEASAKVRKQLLDELAPSWQRVQQHYGARQLHFHLGPGAVSFLRVHRPEKYGDRLDEVRHTVVDTNSRHRARTGFETGRVHSGLRGVVPVWAPDPKTGQRTYVGALEAGISFDYLLDQLDQRFDQGLAVLLTTDHVQANMWPEFIEAEFGQPLPESGFVIESSSRQSIAGLLDRLSIEEIDLRANYDSVVWASGRDYAVHSFPLRDYRGQKDPSLDPVGRVVIWKDVSEQVDMLQRNQRFNVLYGLGAFVVLEGIIFLGVTLVSRRLEAEVQAKTEELAFQATHDHLTGAYNRSHLDELLEKEIKRSNRHGFTFGLIELDIDHFKSVNDNHGHLIGDEILKALTRLIQDRLRGSDTLARWGGEEFMVLAPETDRQGARKIAEDLRQAVTETYFPGPGRVTISLGVTEFIAGQRLKDVVKQADDALYLAKEKGRNQVQTG